MTDIGEEARAAYPGDAQGKPRVFVAGFWIFMSDMPRGPQ
jgi:hypothetical protein